jgi:RNA polymerase sigma factor (sigma-70 family)
MNKYTTIKPQKDLKLVLEAQKGNQRAFTKLFDTYKNQLLVFITLIVKNPTDAEDVTLEVFAKAFEKLKDYVPTYNFSSWLYRIATNTSIDYLRKKNHRPVFTDILIQEVEQYINKIKDPGFTPEDILISEEIHKRFKKAIFNMNPALKRIMEMRYEQGKSCKEISEELDIPMGTVTPTIRRGKQIIYKLLKDI